MDRYIFGPGIGIIARTTVPAGVLQKAAALRVSGESRP